MMKETVFVGIMFLIIIGCILLTAVSLEDNFLSEKELINQQKKLESLKEVYADQYHEEQSAGSEDHDASIRSLAKEFITLHKTRAENNNEQQELFMEFSGGFKQLLYFMDNYLKQELQFVIKNIQLQPQDNGLLKMDLTLSSRLS